MHRKLISAIVASTIATAASAQSTSPAVFVANNGNLEGSVSAFTINPDGSLNFVDKVVTGTAPNLSNPDWGTNCYSISLAPDGRHLAVGHAASDSVPGRLTVMSVNADATLVQQGAFVIPKSPLDLTWLDNQHIAITETSISGVNRVRVYRYDWEEAQLTLADFEPTGNFSSSLALHPTGEFLYVNNSSGNTITAFRINPNGTLDNLQVQGSGSVYPLGLGASPNGRWIYGAGGISSGGKAIIGFDINPATGLMTPHQSQYVSPGQSPKQVVVSTDNAYAIAGHGTDATVRTFSIHPSTGALTPTGFFFDVGFQGSLGNIVVMADPAGSGNDLVFFLDRDTIFDGVRGVYSFTLNPNGALVQNGPLVDTQGIGPNAVAPWPGPAGPGPCPADLTGDGTVDALDLLFMLNAWGACPVRASCTADLNGDGAVDVIDLLALLGAWGPCPKER